MASVPNLIRETTANWKPLAIALLMLAGPGSTNAAWEDVGLKIAGGAPADGEITDFTLFPGATNTTTISATAESANQGVWRSENGGDTWLQQLAGSTYRGTAIQTANTNVVLAGSSLVLTVASAGPTLIRQTRWQQVTRRGLRLTVITTLYTCSQEGFCTEMTWN